MKECDFLYSKFVYENVFTPKECHEIIHLPGKNVEEEERITYNGMRAATSSKYVNYLKETSWIYTRLGELVTDANKYFNFKINQLRDIYVVEYHKNDFIHWHTDSGRDVLNKKKISLIVFLSKPDDYKGGLVKWLETDHQVTVSNKIGNVVLFPSYIPHIVETIEDGKRCSLVGWAFGLNAFT